MILLIKLCNTIASWLNSSKPQDPKWSEETWLEFKHVCLVFGVAPHLHLKLKDVSWLNVTIKQWLEKQYKLTHQRLTLMHSELKAMLAVFEANQVPVIPLKGSLLTTQFYPPDHVRPMSDFDLLVKENDFERCVVLLNTLGYEQGVVHWKHTEFNKPNNRQVNINEPDHPDNPRSLELHLFCRETYGGPTIDLTALMWQHANLGQLLGHQAFILEPDALWLHLLVHANYHLWQGKGRLIHLLDIANLTPHLKNPLHLLNKIDARYTYLCLGLLQKYFPTVIHNTWLENQETRLSPAFKQWVQSLDLIKTSHLNPEPSGLYLFKALKFSEGRPNEVLQALRFSLLPSLEALALDHPKLAQSNVPWLAYFLLPLDWVKRLIK